jgi:two-component system LytT family sensor kinase
METVIIVANILNAFGFIFLWLLCYIPIKIARHSRKNRVERLELQTSLKEAQLNTLKGQINPHFMFNSLNNIRGLMLEDVEKSREMITRLSDMLRYSLTKNDVDTIPLKNELEMVDNYIALSKIQLEDRLSFSSEISEILYTTEIPPMLIQMLVENAVKHGISNEKDGGHVALNISEKNKNLFIEITNTGSLIQAKGSTKIGLKNIAERLALLYGDTARFELSEKDHLVTALIQIPM